MSREKLSDPGSPSSNLQSTSIVTQSPLTVPTSPSINLPFAISLPNPLTVPIYSSLMMSSPPSPSIGPFSASFTLNLPGLSAPQSPSINLPVPSSISPSSSTLDVDKPAGWLAARRKSSIVLGPKCQRGDSWLPALLCLYALLKEIKVGEPFLYKYQTEYLNLTAHQITAEIYPYTPYAYLLSLVPIFLLTDLTLYKPIMLAEIIGQIVFRSTLVFGGSVPSQIVGQIFYGVASAAEIAYFSYIYARLEPHQYQRLTGWTRASTMAGRTCGYLFSQFFVWPQSDQLFALRALNIVAFSAPCVVLLVCAFLPRVNWKLAAARIFNDHESKNEKAKVDGDKAQQEMPKSYLQYALYRLQTLGADFKNTYSNGAVQKWSLWWAMTTCMSLQVALFSQTLWGDSDQVRSPLNGFAEAGYTATATVAILVTNTLPLNWDRWGEPALVLISAADAAVLLLYSRTRSIYVMYGCYICYRSLYQVMITIAQWNIAKKMVCQSYGLVFGVNSFLALGLQSILTIIVTDRRGLALSVRPQYAVYAVMHVAVAIVFFVSVVITTVSNYSEMRRAAVKISTDRPFRKNLSRS